MTQAEANGGTEMLRPKEVAERYGLSYRHVRQLCTEQRIVYYKIGRIIYIPRAEFEAWLAEHRVEAAN
jgi:excisionase family DNA binding protein